MGNPGDRYIHLAEGDRRPSVEAIRTATMQWDASIMFGGHCESTEDKVIMLANLADTELNILKAQVAKNNRIANEALDDACVEAGKVLALETQIADFKERSDIMDSIHKETMEKIKEYENTLMAISTSTYLAKSTKWAREALATEQQPPTKEST